MTSTGTIGSSAHESRTFDCPWCGAISPVPSDHLGEHFACPECRRQTKLTEKNTSTLGVTDVPPDAPHLTGDRTFDCPWCGAIAAVPSSHLGERFVCPECKRDTKLTPTNTRRAPITAPPPDAPPPEPAGPPKALIAVAAVIVVGVAIWAIAGGGGGDDHAGTESAAVPAPTPAPRPSTPLPKGESTPPPPAATTPVPAPTSPPAPEPPAPTTTSPAPLPQPVPTPGPGSAEPNKVDEAALVDAEVKAAEEAKTRAAAEVVAANARVKTFVEANPGADDGLVRLPVLEKLTSQSASIAFRSAEQVRAYNGAVVSQLTQTPGGADVAKAVLARMSSEFHGRGVAGLRWEDLDFHSDAFSRAASAVADTWRASLANVPKDLLEMRAEAAKHESEADLRLERALVRRNALK